MYIPVYVVGDASATSHPFPWVRGDQQDRRMLSAGAPPHTIGRAHKPFQAPCKQLFGLSRSPDAAASQYTGTPQPQEQQLPGQGREAIARLLYLERSIASSSVVLLGNLITNLRI